MSLSKAPSRPSSTFSWSVPPTEKIFSCEVIGEPEIGKTWVAADFPDSALADTENKAWPVMQQKANPHWKLVRTMEELRQFVFRCVSDPSIKSVVIDSGTDMADLAEEEFLHENNMKRVFPIVLYARVYAKIDALLEKIIDSGKYCVVTSRLKKEYVADVETGRLTRDSYKKIPYNFMMLIRLRWGIRDEKGKVWFKDRVWGEVVKNSFYHRRKQTPTDLLAKPWLFDVTFDGIRRELLEPWKEGDVIEQAKAYLDAQGIKFEGDTLIGTGQGLDLNGTLPQKLQMTEKGKPTVGTISKHDSTETPIR